MPIRTAGTRECARRAGAANTGSGRKVTKMSAARAGIASARACVTTARACVATAYAVVTAAVAVVVTNTAGTAVSVVA